MKVMVKGGILKVPYDSASFDSRMTRIYPNSASKMWVFVRASCLLCDRINPSQYASHGASTHFEVIGTAGALPKAPSDQAIFRGWTD